MVIYKTYKTVIMQVYLLQAADIIQITWIWFITDIYRVSSPENNLQGIMCHF